MVGELTVTFSNGQTSTDSVIITVEPEVGSIECELDFDGNGVVNADDYFNRPNMKGIYIAVETYLNDNANFTQYFPDTSIASLDWNGDGNITLSEIDGGEISVETVNTFRTQHWAYLNYQAEYANFYPNSGCEL